MNILVSLLPITIACQVLTVDELLQMNEQSVLAIHSVVADIEIDVRAARGSNPMKFGHRLLWRKQDEHERLSLSPLYPQAEKDGTYRGNSDVYNGPKGYQALLDYRPDNPPPLSAGQDRPAMGVIGHRSNKSSVLRELPEVKLFLRFQYHPKEFIGTLKGLAEFAKRRRLVATPERSAHQCYEIEMEFDERTTVYSLDPQKNFSVRQIHNSQWNPRTQKTATGICNVLKFQDFGSGIFLPTAIQVTVDDQPHTSEENTKVHYHSVNQDIPEKDFHIAFPQWLRVADHVRGKTIVWGENDQPYLEFDMGSPDYMNWFAPHHAQLLMTRPKPWWRRWFWWILGSLAAVGVLIYYRRRAQA